MLANSCALEFCTFTAAVWYSESKTSAKTMLVLATLRSVLANSCALEFCPFTAAVWYSESKTSAKTRASSWSLVITLLTATRSSLSTRTWS